MIIEAAVESLEAAIAAAEGGAHRIELAADLAHDGTTPSLDLIRACRSQLAIPVVVLIRPRAGDFVYSEAEHLEMLEQIRQAKEAGAAGIVSGALTAAKPIAAAQTAALVTAGRPLPFTFHRAFDACAHQAVALETLIQLRVDRVLTSGGAPTAPAGAAQIRSLAAQAKARIVIMAGSGINASNVAQLVRDSRVREVHFSVTEAGKVQDVIERLRSRSPS
ncbi:MAG: copper homeostasis protein CutC [Gemmatimonadales bacterium]